MRVMIVARPEMSPVELFDLAVEQGVTAIIDLRRRPGPVPLPLRHIYQQPPARLTDHFVKRFLQHGLSEARRTTPQAVPYGCDEVLLLLTDQDFASEARELIRQLRPQAQIDDGK